MHLVFPRACVVCSALVDRAYVGLACAVCWASVRQLPRPLCTRCGHPRPHVDKPCRWCTRLAPAIIAGGSYCWLSAGCAERVVYALKYDGWSRIADELAARMSRIPLQHDAALGQRATRCQGGAARRVLVPVPLSARKLKERGYNQSELLARALADRTDSSCAPNLLVRMRDTTSQTRLTPEQRLHNVADAFRVDPVVLARHADALVVIVDDVVTTGATLNACAAALAAAGARAIGFVTFGRAADPRASR